MPEPGLDYLVRTLGNYVGGPLRYGMTQNQVGINARNPNSPAGAYANDPNPDVTDRYGAGYQFGNTWPNLAPALMPLVNRIRAAYGGDSPEIQSYANEGVNAGVTDADNAVPSPTPTPSLPNSGNSGGGGQSGGGRPTAQTPTPSAPAYNPGVPPTIPNTPPPTPNTPEPTGHTEVGPIAFPKFTPAYMKKMLDEGFEWGEDSRSS